MKILIFTEFLYPSGSGAELATWLYSKFLAEKGFEITIVTQEETIKAAYSNLKRINFIKLPVKVSLGSRYDTLFNIGAFSTSFIKNLIKENDVVYIPNYWYSIIPLVKALKKPLVTHLHNYSISCPLSLMYDLISGQTTPSSLKSYLVHEKIERKRNVPSYIFSLTMNELIGKYYNRLAMLSDALIFVSNAQKSLVTSILPRIAAKSYMVYNPIPDIAVCPSEYLGLGFFGGKRYIKGYHVLINSLKLVRTTAPLEVFMTNTTNLPSTFLFKKTRLNLLSRLERPNFEQLMKKLSIVLIPSIWPEPAPYALVESMLFGKVIVATRVGGIPEIAGKSPGVFQIEPNDSRQLADAISTVANLSVDDISMLGFKNRETILRRFDNASSVSQISSIFDRVSGS